VRRFAILLAAVGALLLVPAASALANNNVIVTIEGTGSGEVNGVGGFYEEGSPTGFFESNPPLECSYNGETETQSGVCEGELFEVEPGFEGVALRGLAASGSERLGWIVESGANLIGCDTNAEQCVTTSSGGNVELTAIFGPEAPPLPLTINTAGTGSGTFHCGDPAKNPELYPVCSAEYKEGTELAIWTAADEGSTFTGWSGCDSEKFEGGKTLCIVTMTEAREVTANIEAEGPAGPPLTLNIEEGEGTVVSNPAGLSCSGAAPTSCTTEEIAEGSVVLTASPAPGYIFKSWKKCDTGGVNGRQCTINLNAAKEVGAKFVKVWPLSVSKAGSGIGKAQTSPGGILCLYNCSEAEAVFKEGSVTVKQAAAKHNHFVQWLGDCSGSEPTCSVSMTEAHSVEAEFAPDTQYTLSLAKEGGGQGSIKSKPSGLLCGYTCNSQVASFYSGEEVLITYKLNKGTTKLTWSTGAGTCTGSTEALEGTCTVPMAEAQELVADFS
jgi:hypothetical protein